MSGGRASRHKGNRSERIVVRLLQEYGFAAERVPLSRAARSRFGGDVSVPLLGVGRRVEVKCRAHGFRELYKWLTGVDVLVPRADRSEPLVVVPFVAKIGALAERMKESGDA
jgi:Holliday junction resolvase